MGKVKNKKCKNINIVEVTIIDNDDDSPPPNNQLNNMNTVGCNTVNPSSEIQEIIDITDEYDCVLNQASSSETKSLNIENDYTIDITKNFEQRNNTILSQTICGHKNPIELIILDSDDEENTQEKQSVKNSNNHNSIKESCGVSDYSKKAIQKHRNKNVCYHKQLLNVVNAPFNFNELSVNHQNNLQHSKNNEHIKIMNVPSKPPQPSTNFPCTTLMKTTRQLRPIYIDGLNIGHAYGHGTFSAKGIELCIEYFAARGHTDILVFIPQHRQGPPGSLSKFVLSKLFKKGHICYTPSRKINDRRMTCYDDRHVMVTFARDEIIVPDDQYNGGPCTLNLSDILCFPA
ncbi:NEDD4-binding protein 1-like isoform X2 [Sipha flava]|uniref:NEDD4-binding protein 1-like isoform X2 n=1 Tax=Sipha flava TaxID=143950 RepID=A0A8B8FGY8_9HEMI|nr:NEDD4-binding protein 1-like isoform X2 [Sipha flava]